MTDAEFEKIVRTERDAIEFCIEQHLIDVTNINIYSNFKKIQQPRCSLGDLMTLETKSKTQIRWAKRHHQTKEQYGGSRSI